MKRLLIVILFYWISQSVYGQACGIYRIEYVGNISSTVREVEKVYLPTTMFLHKVEDDKSKKAFIDTTLTNGLFRLQIASHLTTPYNNVDQLLSYFKTQSDKFIMKVSYWENSSLKEATIEIDWNKIAISIIEDGKFGTLFKFTLKSISI